MNLDVGKYRVFDGQILYVDSERVVAIYKGVLWESRDSGVNWIKKNMLELDWWRFIGLRSRIIERALRLGIKSYIAMNSQLFCFTKREVFSLHLELDRVSSYSLPQSMKPPLLGATDASGRLLLGEYSRNKHRNPIRLLRLSATDLSVEVNQILSGIRHVHGVFFDHNTATIFVTTGDEDSECGIWRWFPDDKLLEPMLTGSQEFRAVQLLFTEKGIVFGTDAPDRINHIAFWNRKQSSMPVNLAQVGGPVFYGATVGKCCFLTTACEPSTVNRTDACELWAAKDGQNWVRICEFYKDQFPMKYFGYGVLRFPAGKGDGKNLWLSTNSVVPDNSIYKIPVADIMVALR